MGVGSRRRGARLAARDGRGAPGRRGGPAAGMGFRGGRLGNAGGRACLGLTGWGQRKLKARLGEWSGRRPQRPGETVGTAPRELAQLLGHLVFCSDVIPGGRTYMQAMLRQFVGLEVDWIRGQVRFARSAWRHVRLTAGFWRDLHWWASALETANSVDMAAAPTGDAVLSGSDASDYACGELVWLDGQREETQLVFTSAERRRPINFRELRGCLRVLERWGERLRGRALVVELDNTAAVGASTKLFSKAEDMQELVRRVLSRCTRLQISLRVHHTPGARLTRPDQTSRGLSPEEPRQRVSRELFVQLEARFGPFDSFVGAEREHTAGRARATTPARPGALWLHPTFDTVASALRLIGEQLGGSPDSSIRGLLLVPLAPSAKWWGLLRHFAVVGRIPVGSAHLEAYQWGRWQRHTSMRATLLLHFPRSLGATPLPLLQLVGLGAGAEATGPCGAEESQASAEAARPLSSAPRVGRRQRGAVKRFVARAAPPPAELRRAARFDQSGAPPSELLEGSQAGGEEAAAPAGAEMALAEGMGALALSPSRLGRPVGATDGATRESSAEALLSRWAVTPAAPLPEGTVLYSPLRLTDAEAAQERAARRAAGLPGGPTGCVYITCGPFGGEERPLCVWARRWDRQGADPGIFIVDARSSAAGGAPWQPVVSSLWLCGHIATDLGGGRYRFDFERAEREIAGMRDALAAGAAAAEPAGLGAADPGEARADLLAAGRAEGELEGPEAEPAVSGFGARHDVPIEREGRLRPPPAGVAGPRVGLRVPVSQTGRPVQVNRAAGARCQGCDERLPEGVFVCSGGTGLVHNTATCFDRAERQMLEAAHGAAGRMREAARRLRVEDAEAAGAPAAGGMAAAAEGGAAPARAPAAVSLRKAQLDASLGEARCELAQSCLDGACGVDEPHDMTCSTCDARLHGMRCAQLTRGHASVGVFLCVACRVRKQFPTLAEASWPAEARAAHLRAMLFELVTSAEGTGGTYADVVSLVRSFSMATAPLLDPSSLVSPLDDSEVFKSFLLWVVRDRERARSLVTIWRASGALMLRSARENLTLRGDVKAFYGQLAVAHGETSTPRTATTPTMMRLLHEKVLPELFPGPEKRRLLTRHRVALTGECVGGLRVAEMLGGGDHHGLLAPNVRLLRDLETGEESVELVLEHSKTKFKRYVGLVDVTLGKAGFPVVQYLRDYWSAWGFELLTETVGRYVVTSADYYVLRVSLLGLTLERVEAMLAVLAISQSAEVRAHAAVSRVKGLERYKASGSMDKKYINVAGGRAGCHAVATASLELSRAGFGDEGRLHVIGGPFGRATQGASTTHMPIVPRSTAEVVVKAHQRAYVLANADSPDLDLDLEGLDEPLWGDHSDRRGADTNARRSMGITEATEMDLDLYFGWQERMYSQKMQVHYESTFTRVRRKAVTSRL